MSSISTIYLSRVLTGFPSPKHRFKLGIWAIMLSFLAFLAACATAPEPVAPPISANTSVSAATARPQTAPPRDIYLVPATNVATPAGMTGIPLVRVALLAPFSSPNAALRDEAATLQSAAELAIAERGNNGMLLLPKDSGDTPEVAREAVRRALQEGADFILGPLFASGVGAIAPYARANKVPMISFSTDVSEAGRGIYVLTFLPEDEAQRIVRFAAARGVKRLVILAPVGRYGDRIVEAASTTARSLGMAYLGASRYDPQTSAIKSAQDSARVAAQMASGGLARETAILIPERGALLRTIVQALTQAGASTSKVRYLGTGLWNDKETLSDVRLAGGWYVTPDAAARASFEQRFRDRYGRRPTRLAGMGYDATALIAGLTRGGNARAASQNAIETPDGFVGVDGLFRFNQGVVQRGMAINEVDARGGRTLEAAPTRFVP
jgi:ABC-type branched-subunit amino acid transport system substrate-binding protein